MPWTCPYAGSGCEFEGQSHQQMKVQQWTYAHEAAIYETSVLNLLNVCSFRTNMVSKFISRLCGIGR